MKTRLLGALVGLAISLALPTFAQQKETVDPKIIEQLDALGKKFDEAFNNNDAAAVAALFTEDAIWVVDTGPLYGRQAIEKQVAEWFKGARSSNHIDKIDPNSPRIVSTADK
jgi:ketosteroid isomerase-like protein